MRPFTCGEVIERLDGGWRMALSQAGGCPDPKAAEGLEDWIEAAVPGAAAGALSSAGRSLDSGGLHGLDIWWRRPLSGDGRRIVRFEGVATQCEVWLDDRLVGGGGSMFQPFEVEVELDGEHELWLVCRSLEARLQAKGPRARWRTQMIPRQGLRHVRTTLLGQMPGWTPPIDAVGPFREIALITPGVRRIEIEQIRSELAGDVGRLYAQARISPAPVEPVILTCGGVEVVLAPNGDGLFGGELEIEGVRPWWPHTHGTPNLYEVALQVEGQACGLGRTGFRRIELDRGPDGRGFGLRINGQAVFCRGAVWTSPGLRDLPGDAETYRPLLERARSAGMNMLRMSGVGVYETRAFYDLCDEMGLLVWQDLMLANFDYPIADPAFHAALVDEARGFLVDRRLCPALAVLSGGSEIHQQGAMLGIKPEALANRFLDVDLPALIAELRPGLIYTPSSPFGGAHPFVVDEGVSHYYGVGAYGRGLDDLRRSNLRFAAECLAFANVPSARSLKGRVTGAPGHDPAWKAGVPRDLGASWDFEDVRDTYLGLLYGQDADQLRRERPGLYLDLSRAVSGDLMTEAFGEWRRPASTCAGALVWTLQDILPGAGWGLLDDQGGPKPAWYGFRRAAQPLQVSLTDEGLNGLFVHLLNEPADERHVRLEIDLWRDGRVRVARARRDLVLPGRSQQTLSLFSLLGGFLDVTYAYRFGPPGHDLTTATLLDAIDGTTLSEALHHPQGRGRTVCAVEAEATLALDVEGWRLDLTSGGYIGAVHIDDEQFEPDDDWFPLLPGRIKTVRLRPRSDGPQGAGPQGLVLAPGGVRLCRYAAPPAA
jgi:beta-mannosidase